MKIPDYEIPVYEIQDYEMQAVETAVTQALESRREPVVPVDFAARVRQSLPVLPPRRRRISFGRTAAMAMAAVTAVLAFVLAPHASANFASLAFDAECFFTLQAMLIAAWLIRQPS